MASLFKNRNNWFLAVSYKGKRITKSLGTTDKTVAKELKPLVESHILAELIGILPKKKNIPFCDLVKKFLHFWHKTQPDIITGWNIQFFDIPYLCN